MAHPRKFEFSPERFCAALEASPKIRRRAAPDVGAGLAACARCGMPIYAMEAWDIDSLDGGAVWAPSHRWCNRSMHAGAGGRG